MVNKVKTLLKMVNITCSSSYAMQVANEYWQNTTVTHTSMNEVEFDDYYQKIFELLNPNKDNTILDYGGGNGEIAFRFQQKGYEVEHCDISKEMVSNAINQYGLKSSICSKLKDDTYNKILFHNAFFYVHPSLVEALLKNMHSSLLDNGQLYITDTPDFDKRENLNLNKVHMFFTKLFPVYQVNMSGFYVEHKKLEALAQKIGFKIEKFDSWCNYRSHWILTKV